MLCTFHCYETKGPIEADVKSGKSTKDILKMLKRLRPSFNDKI